jgi:hypothetical protein
VKIVPNVWRFHAGHAGSFNDGVGMRFADLIKNTIALTTSWTLIKYASLNKQGKLMTITYLDVKFNS